MSPMKAAGCSFLIPKLTCRILPSHKRKLLLKLQRRFRIDGEPTPFPRQQVLFYFIIFF
uniref:Uncharacterized protein n=1 Tax=Anguilla anguilla TaxID=7936 RepID=A0A0E9S5I2_ANGAN